MYGAMIGDIVGSRFEFDRGPWTKDFDLFTDECNITDDTVMTAAVANALSVGKNDATIIERVLPIVMQYWYDKYPNAGYGVHFLQWLNEDDPEPYNSFGNGSAMRVSPVGWFYDTIAATRLIARVTAKVSHNHPEGIKGADCTATVIFKAKTGETMRNIREFVDRVFGYDVNTVEYYREHHAHVETCMDSMPKALAAFYESTSFEDAIRNAVSMGGDADTIAAITGSMAEAFYGVPHDILEKAKTYIPKDILEITEDFFRNASY